MARNLEWITLDKLKCSFIWFLEFRAIFYPKWADIKEEEFLGQARTFEANFPKQLIKYGEDSIQFHCLEKKLKHDVKFLEKNWKLQAIAENRIFVVKISFFVYDTLFVKIEFFFYREGWYPRSWLSIFELIFRPWGFLTTLITNMTVKTRSDHLFCMFRKVRIR